MPRILGAAAVLMSEQAAVFRSRWVKSHGARLRNGHNSGSSADEPLGHVHSVGHDRALFQRDSSDISVAASRLDSGTHKKGVRRRSAAWGQHEQRHHARPARIEHSRPRQPRQHAPHPTRAPSPSTGRPARTDHAPAVPAPSPDIELSDAPSGCRKIRAARRAKLRGSRPSASPRRGPAEGDKGIRTGGSVMYRPERI